MAWGTCSLFLAFAPIAGLADTGWKSLFPVHGLRWFSKTPSTSWSSEEYCKRWSVVAIEVEVDVSARRKISPPQAACPKFREVDIFTGCWTCRHQGLDF